MSDSEKIRLQKVISEQGLASRREAELWISEGRVEVNGEIATLGQKVDINTDRIKIDGRCMRKKGSQEKITLAMNKPRGLLCSNGDPFHEKTVFDILPKRYQGEKMFCAGRLDKESEGLLILTNDGDLANSITHPSKKVIKRYQVTLSKPIDVKHIPLLLKGIKSEGEFLFASKIIASSKGPKAGCQIEVHLEQGRKREIRRLFERFGYFVDRLKRIQIGRLRLTGISKGLVKKLSRKEITQLLES